jgi:ribosomal protein L16/L10AE
VPAKTIEAIRRALRRKIKKTAKLWIRVAATVPITKKPAEVRSGRAQCLCVCGGRGAAEGAGGHACCRWLIG